MKLKKNFYELLKNTSVGEKARESSYSNKSRFYGKRW